MARLDIVVRPPETEAEIEAYFLVQAQIWQPQEDAAKVARRYREGAESSPDFDRQQMRAAFARESSAGETRERCVGGAGVEEGELRLPPAVLRIGCIGGVATHPDFRRAGIGRALIDDAVAWSIARGHALMMLDGITNFYHRWGFVDVWDLTEHFISRAQALDQPPSPYRVRPATLVDAEEMLALYQRHYGGRAGSFARTIATQRHDLQQRPPERPMLLALDEQGAARGYLAVGGMPARATEVAADDWPAALALLQHHARRLDSLPEPPDEIHWPLPPDALTLYLLQENVASWSYMQPGAATAPLADWPVVRGVTYQHANAGWMARPADHQALIAAVLPRWQAFWRRVRTPWTGTLTLALGGKRWSFEAGPDELRLLPAAVDNGAMIELTDDVFVKLLFSYRTVEWAAEQPGQRIPGRLRPVVDCLFPREQVWIPGTDWF